MKKIFFIFAAMIVFLSAQAQSKKQTTAKVSTEKKSDANQIDANTRFVADFSAQELKDIVSFVQQSDIYSEKGKQIWLNNFVAHFQKIEVKQKTDSASKK